MVEAAALQNGMLKACEGGFLRFCGDKHSWMVEIKIAFCNFFFKQNAIKLLYGCKP